MATIIKTEKGLCCSNCKARLDGEGGWLRRHDVYDGAPSLEQREDGTFTAGKVSDNFRHWYWACDFCGLEIDTDIDWD